MFTKGGNPMSTLGERLKTVRTSLPHKMSQEAFAESLSTTRAAYVKYEMDMVQPNEVFISHVCSTYDISPLWLKDGEGEMKKLPADDEELVDRVMAGENEFAKSVMKAFAKLSDEEWRKLRDVVEALKKAGE
jgi:transcriptional regulator with XRE-family HTH domain